MKELVKVTICGIETEVNKLWYEWIKKLANKPPEYYPWDWHDRWRKECRELQDAYRKSEGLSV